MRSKEPAYRAAYWQTWVAKNRPRQQRTCPKCFAGFYPTGPQKVCAACRILTCAFCGKQFTSPSGRLTQKFCSQVCQASRPENTERLAKCRGVKPRTYHLRHRDKHGSAADRDWRKAVFARDNYTCQNCGAKGCRIQAHHIKAYKAHPELRHNLSNGLTLCIPCHKQTDTFGWQNYWRSRIAAKRLSQEVLAFGETSQEQTDGGPGPVQDVLMRGDTEEVLDRMAKKVK